MKKRRRSVYFHVKEWPSVSASAATAVLITCYGFSAVAEENYLPPSLSQDSQNLNVQHRENIVTKFIDSKSPILNNESDQFLFLQVQIKDLPSKQTIISALDRPGQLLLPFADFVQAFEFPIAVDQKNGKASGFYISPENEFRLDMDDRSVRSGNKEYLLSYDNFRKHDGKLYISTQGIAEWFGINSSVDRTKGTIHFTTNRALPKEERQVRHNKWRLLASLKEANGNLPAIMQTTFVADSDSSMLPPVGYHEFVGDAETDYDIEIYKDNILIGYDTVKTDRRYRFANIPLHTGENVFKIIAYGPQGQRWEKNETITTRHLSDDSKNKNPPKANLFSSVLNYENNAPETSGKKQTTASLKSWLEIALTRDNQTLGMVECHHKLTGNFFRFDQVLRAVGIAYKRSESTEALDVLFSDGRVLSLDLAKQEYIENGRVKSLYSNDAFLNDGTIYVNSTFLNRVLTPYRFVEDIASRSLEVSTSVGEAFGIMGGLKTADKSDMAPTPIPSPVVPVIIDDLSGNHKVTGSQEIPEATDVLHIAQEPLSTGIKLEADSDVLSNGNSPSSLDKTPSGPSIVSDTQKGDNASPVEEGEEPLILQPRIKKIPPNNLFIEAYSLAGKIFLPLNDLMQIFEFPIKVDDRKGTANGFFISPDNIFSLEMEGRTVRIGKDILKFTDNEMRLHKGQLYLSAESFANWFSINSDIDRKLATIHFTTDKRLPQEEQEERQKRWQKMLASIDEKRNDFPVLQNDYKAVGYPAIDVNIGSQYDHGASNSKTSAGGPFTSSYNIQGSADLAYMTSQFYAQGATNGSVLDTLRFQMGRKDPTGDLLGAMGATEYAFGDVISPAISLVTSNSLGRGATISNRELNSSENFDVRNFTGDSVPGYEVELYRNNVLVAFQTVDANGRYNFANIPILYGENIFRIVFYGPQGQREEKVETVSASSALLKNKQFVYNFGIDQRGANFIPLGKNSVSNELTPVGLQAVGSLRYGLTKDITIGSAFAQTRLRDGDHRYASATASANIEGLLAETTAAQDLSHGGWAGSLSALGGFEGVSLRAKYRKFKDFASEAVNNLDTPLSSDASLDANTQLLLPLIGGYGVGLSALRETFVSNGRVPRYTFSWRSSKSIWGLSFTDSVEYIVDEKKRIQDVFGVQTRMWDIDWRAVGTYELEPIRQFRNINFSADYRLLDRLSGKSIIEKDLTESDRTSFGQSLNWDFDDFRLSFNGQMDNSKNIALGINLLFSLNHDSTTSEWRSQPQQASSGGAITGRAYIDDNNNNKFDEGEKTLSEAKIRVNRLRAKNDADGYFVAPVTPYETARVELDTSSISDPLLAPATKGYYVNTRPGDMVVADFPLARSTIIDGTVVFLDENGGRRELNDIIVELTDKDGKPLRRVITAIDGYFSIDKITVGEYWLIVPEEALTAYNASFENKIHIKIDDINEFITGKDIVLRQKEKLNGPPVFEDSTKPDKEENSEVELHYAAKEKAASITTSEISIPLVESHAITDKASITQDIASLQNVIAESQDQPYCSIPQDIETYICLSPDYADPSHSRLAFLKKTLKHYAPPSYFGLSERITERLAEESSVELSNALDANNTALININP